MQLAVPDSGTDDPVGTDVGAGSAAVQATSGAYRHPSRQLAGIGLTRGRAQMYLYERTGRIECIGYLSLGLFGRWVKPCLITSVSNMPLFIRSVSLDSASC